MTAREPALAAALPCALPVVPALQVTVSSIITSVYIFAALIILPALSDFL